MSQASIGGHSLLLIVTLKVFAVRPLPDSRHQYAEVYETVKAKVAEIEARGGSERFFISGRPVVEGVFGAYMPQEMKPRSMAFCFMSWDRCCVAVLIYQCRMSA